ncbi:MAG: hypothetical protein O3C43_22450 [Verrucomicrobia bacterium]|nr:hypothetical protein [Verrucomicrobiota bacterium]
MKSPFRSIRMKLFLLRQGSEGHVISGKLLRYLGYTVGEIALIIIGIMMVLQLNNWNEDRKAQVEFDAYILQLKADIAHEVILNKEVTEFTVSSAIKAHSIIRFIERDTNSDEELEAFEGDLNQLGNFRREQLNTGLLGKLMNGKTQVISRDPFLYKRAMELMAQLNLQRSVLNNVSNDLYSYRALLPKYIGPRHLIVPEMRQRYD